MLKTPLVALGSHENPLCCAQRCRACWHDECFLDMQTLEKSWILKSNGIPQDQAKREPGPVQERETQLSERCSHFLSAVVSCRCVAQKTEALSSLGHSWWDHGSGRNRTLFKVSAPNQLCLFGEHLKVCLRGNWRCWEAALCF